MSSLTHWGRVTHIWVSDLTSIGSDNGLSPGRRQAIIRTNAGILLIRPLGTNFSEFLVEIITFSFKKMRLKVSSAKRRPFCLGLNELNWIRALLMHESINWINTDPAYWLDTWSEVLSIDMREHTWVKFIKIHVQLSYQENVMENVCQKLLTLFRPQCVNGKTVVGSSWQNPFYLLHYETESSTILWYNITHNWSMTRAGYRLDYELTKYTP